MQHDIRTDHGVTILIPHPTRLDAATAPALRDALLAQLDAGASRLLLDLSRVTFLDSSALGALIAVAKRAAASARFGVAGTQPAVARLFVLTQMDRVFPIHVSLDDALARFTA